jgi:hypothetical protein
MLVAIRNHVEAHLERVCLVVAGVPHAPSGAAVIRAGETSPMIALASTPPGAKGAVYFELRAETRNIPLITDELFDIAPGSRLVITIGDNTRFHNASVEVEGAVARIALAGRGSRSHGRPNNHHGRPSSRAGAEPVKLGMTGQ